MELSDGTALRERWNSHSDDSIGLSLSLSLKGFNGHDTGTATSKQRPKSKSSSQAKKPNTNYTSSSNKNGKKRQLHRSSATEARVHVPPAAKLSVTPFTVPAAPLSVTPFTLQLTALGDPSAAVVAPASEGDSDSTLGSDTDDNEFHPTVKDMQDCPRSLSSPESESA